MHANATKETSFCNKKLSTTHEAFGNVLLHICSIKPREWIAQKMHKNSFFINLTHTHVSTHPSTEKIQARKARKHKKCNKTLSSFSHRESPEIIQVQTERTWNPSQICAADAFFISKTNVQDTQDRKKARESSKSKHDKAVEQAQQTSGQKVWQFMHLLSRNFLFFRWFLELQFLGFWMQSFPSKHC